MIENLRCNKSMVDKKILQLFYRVFHLGDPVYLQQEVAVGM